MSVICNLEENPELAQSIGDYINASIKESLESDKLYRLSDSMKAVYDAFYSQDKNIVKALGVAAVVPQVFLQVLKLKPNYLIDLLDKGFQMDPIYKFAQDISSAENPIELTAKTLKIAFQPTIAQSSANKTFEPKKEILISAPDSKTIKAKLLTSNTFSATSGNNLVDINHTDPFTELYYRVQRGLLSANVNNEPTYENVEYGGHTGFKLRLMFAKDLPNPQKNLYSNTSEDAIISAITDNDGNFLYFNDQGQVVSSDEGRIVNFPIRDWNSSVNKENLIDSSIKKIASVVREETKGDTALEAQRLEELRKEFTTAINKESEELNKISEPLTKGNIILADITGGFIGSTTDPAILKDKEIKKLVEKRFSEFKGSKEQKESLLNTKTTNAKGNQAYGVKFDNGAIVPVKGTLIANENPELFDRLINLLVDDFVDFTGNPVSGEQKKNLFSQFTKPQKLVLSVSNNNLIIHLDNKILDLENKETAKEELKKVLANPINGAYFDIISKPASTNSYEDFSINNGVLTTERKNYSDFISQYVIPRVVFDETTKNALVANGYLRFKVTETDAQLKAKTSEAVANAKKQTNKYKGLDEFGLERSKLLKSKANKLQKETADKWEKEAKWLKAKDSEGKPLFSVARLTNIVNSDAFATFVNGAITLYAGSDSTHLYHEAWHAFSQVYLTKAERDALYKAAASLPGSFTVVRKVGGPGVTNSERVTVKFSDLDPMKSEDRILLEEFIAEEFRTYAMNNGKFKVEDTKSSKLARFFKRIWEALKTLLKGTLPVNVYSNPGSQGAFTEMFNALYTAKDESDLSEYTPSLDNIEFGTLNAGAIYSPEGKMLLSPTKTALLSKSIDGIISEVTTQLVEMGYKGAVLDIVSKQEWIKRVYNVQVREALTERLTELQEEYAANESKWNDIEKDYHLDLIDTLEKGLANYGDITGILENKVSDNSLIAYHLQNSVYKNAIKKGITAEDENDKSPDPFDLLSKTGGLDATDVEAVKLAAPDTVYLLSTLVKQEFKNGSRETVLNKLGFPEPIEFRPFYNLLIEKAGSQQTINNLYNKLLELKALKLSPLVDQLLDKLGDPNLVTDNNNASKMWTALFRTFSLARVDHVNTRFIEKVKTVGDKKELEISSITGQISAAYFTIKNEIWPAKFSVATGQFVKVNKNNQNTLNLSTIYSQFLKETRDADGYLKYTLADKKDPLAFLSAIGIYMSDKTEVRKKLSDKNIAQGLVEIYNTIGHAYRNRESIEIVDPVQFLSKAVLMPTDRTVNNKVENISYYTKPQTGVIKTLAEIEADNSTEYANQMRVVADGSVKSVFTTQNSFTRIQYALNNAENFNEFSDYSNDLGYIPHLDRENNPAVIGSVYMNTMYTANGDRNSNIEFMVNNASGAQFITANEEKGVAQKDMTNNENFVSNLTAFLDAGYIEAVANSDKNTYITGKLNKVDTYTGKDSDHLFIDTEAFIVDKDGKYIHGVNPVAEIAKIMIPKLEGELKRIAKYEQGITDEQAAQFGLKEGQGKDFYKKHVSGYENGAKFDFFDDILNTADGDFIKEKLLKDYLPQLSDTVSLGSLLSKDTEFQRTLVKEIYNYFGAVASQLKQQDYERMFKNALPDFLRTIVTKNIKNKDLLSNVSNEALINALLMSFAVNQTLHADEMILIQFGDGFQFSHAKDEFTKRTSPYFSPGIIAPSDELALKMLNKHAPREYEKARIEAGKVNKTEVRKIERVGNKAILNENITRSAQYAAYHNLFKKTLEKRLQGEELEKMLYGEKDGKIGTYNKPVGGIMESFDKMKTADGQGWITFDFYRALKWAENNWSPAQEAAYQKEIKGIPISAEELTELFPVLKEGYAGPLATEKGILSIQSIDKFSLLPLIPSLVKDTPFELIQDRMMEEGIDYMMFKSSAKRSFVKSGLQDADGNVSDGDPIFLPGKSGELDPRFLSGEMKFTKNPFFMEYLKNQTEVNKEFKEEGTLSTQYRKIFDLGLFEDGVPVDAKMSSESWEKLSEQEKKDKSKVYKNTERVFELLDKLVKQMSNDLLEEMNWAVKDGQLKGSPEDMITFLKKKLEAQGFTQEDIAGLETDGQSFPDLSSSVSAARLEKFVFSIVNKKLIRLKVTGEPLVQASNVGLQKFRKPTKEELEEYTDKDLKPYVIDPDGEKNTKGFGFKIALTENYKSLYKTDYFAKDETGKYTKAGVIAVFKNVIDSKTGKPILNEKTKKPLRVIDEEASFNRLNEMLKLDIWLNTDKNREKIQISGLRIPGQSPNATTFGEVAQFLPPSAGNIIIMPAEIVAIAGSDFDVDKLNSYTKFLTQMGSLLEDTMSLDEVNKELEGLQPYIKKLKADKFTINAALDEFRKKIYKIIKFKNFSTEQIKALTTRDNRKLLEVLANPANQYFLKTQAKAAYKIYTEKIEKLALTSDEYDEVEDVLNSLYDKDADLYFYMKKYSDLSEYKNNYSQVIMNSLVDAIIKVQEMPELAFSLILPNGTYLAKPFADELRPIVQKADGISNFELSIKTGKKIPGRSKGVSPTRAREFYYNKDKRQGNKDAKNSLGVIAKEIPLNGILNKAGAEFESHFTETVKVPGPKNKAVEITVDTPITIMLPHRYNTYVEAERKIRKISLSKLTDANKVNQVADVLSQLTNGAVDAGKDNWIAYLQGNLEGIPKILAMLEMGVPMQHIAYFINNPITRKYISIKRERKSKLLNLFEAFNPNNYDPKSFKAYYTDLAVNTPEGQQAKYSTNSLFGLHTMLKGYMKETGLDINTFNLDNLKEVAYSSINTTNSEISKKQIAGFLQYLYIEKLVEPFDTLKDGMDLDTNTNTDAHAIYAKLKMIEAAENIKFFGKKVMDYIKNKSIISSFYPVLDFAMDLFGRRLFNFRTNPVLENFIFSIEQSPKQFWMLKNTTGYDQETFGNKFKNAVSLAAFTNELKQYKEGSDIYKQVPIEKLFNQDSPIKSIDDAINDFTKQNFIHDPNNPNSYLTRGLYPIKQAAIDGLTANDFVELSLEREYLRKIGMPMTEDLMKSKHVVAIKQKLINSGAFRNLSEEELNKITYENLILNEALLNTFNFWQMFKSGDNTVASKLSNIINNYPELSVRYSPLFDRIMIDPLKTEYGLELTRNARLKAIKELDKDLSEEYLILWKELANTGNIDKAKLLKSAQANKYVSQFFEQLPIFLFLQSGMDSSKFSFNKIMPTDNYLKIMSNGLKNFANEYFTKTPSSAQARRGLYELFLAKNSYNLRNLLHRGDDYKKTKLQLQQIGGKGTILTKPYIKSTDNPRVFLIDLSYSEDGIKKQVTRDEVAYIKDNFTNEIALLLTAEDVGMTSNNVQEAKDLISARINEILASNKIVIINSAGFAQPSTPTQEKGPEDTDETTTCNTSPF